MHTDDLNERFDGAELIVHGKGDKQRVVPITAALAAEILSACPSARDFCSPAELTVTWHRSAWGDS